MRSFLLGSGYHDYEDRAVNDDRVDGGHMTTMMIMSPRGVSDQRKPKLKHPKP